LDGSTGSKPVGRGTTFALLAARASSICSISSASSFLPIGTSSFVQRVAGL
jgi:hypothetical protein